MFSAERPKHPEHAECSGRPFRQFLPAPAIPAAFPARSAELSDLPDGTSGFHRPDGTARRSGADRPARASGASGRTGTSGCGGFHRRNRAAGRNGRDRSARRSGRTGLAGPQGPAGATGATGATGPTGPAGGAALSAYAFGSVEGSLTAAANTPISFPTFAVQPVGAITQSAGTFTLVTPGTYLVTAVLNPPPGSAVNADAVLRSNGTAISSTRRALTTTTTPRRICCKRSSRPPARRPSV